MTILGIIYLCVQASTCTPENALGKIERQYRTLSQCGPALLLEAELARTLDPEKYAEVREYKGSCQKVDNA